MDGFPSYAHDQDREIVRDGMTGKAAQWSGFWAEPVTVETITHLAAGTDIDTALLNYSALIKALVTIADDWGNTRNNIKVLNVRFLRAYSVACSSPSGVGCRLHCQWDLEDWSTYY